MTSTWTTRWVRPRRTCTSTCRPYSDVHLRTELAGYVTTSLALIVTKGEGREVGGERGGDGADAPQPLVSCCSRRPFSRLWMAFVFS